MSTQNVSRFRTTGTETRHCKQDALSDRQFERLIEATYRLDDYYSLEARFVAFAAGRLGLRAGEIAHMREGWLDRQDRMICIPRHDGCTDGKDGGICGHCRSAARQMAEIHDDVSVEQASEWMWAPKTPNSAREIPYDATSRAAIAVEDYFDRFDQFQVSQTGVNRRVDRAAEQAEGIDADSIYPHALRATAASYWAARGLSASPLKALFGWEKIRTAMSYIEDSGERTARAIDGIVA